MKIRRMQFTNEYYRLWEMGLLLPAPEPASIFSIQYRKNESLEYSRVTLKASSLSDAMERACYAVTYSSPWRPEDIDLHSVYDAEENPLWIDDSCFEFVTKKSNFRGMERREFLSKFGVMGAALLLGLRPHDAHAQLVPFAFFNQPATPSGEQLFTSPGSYTWIIPGYVTSVCAVCIGAGGKGSSRSGGNGSTVGGGGGGLGWKNNIAVTPGTQISVIVASSSGTNSSYFLSLSTVVGYSGTNGNSTPLYTSSPGGSFIGEGGGSGGSSGLSGSSGASGGGGAGGYAGSGGIGGSSGGSSASGGTGGGAGGGGGSPEKWGAGGGGTGLYGQGANGGGGYFSTIPSSGLGGSGGTSAIQSKGGNYGGGGGGADEFAGQLGEGGNGAVRIIWGPGRSFPNNAS